MSADRTVLKVLAGAQAGAEVSLEPGEYSIGNGPDDDIQFVDVSIKPQHARLRLAPGKMEIKSGAGPLAIGAEVEAEGGEWRELQPLDVVSAGTTRFAFGPPSAKWSTIADHATLAASKPRQSDAKGARASSWRSRATAWSGAMTLLLIFGVAAGAFILDRHPSLIGNASQAKNQVKILRAAFDKFPFGRAIRVRQDVDGAIYVTGFVQTPVERRAITGAIAKSGISVRLRLGVLQVFRDELDGLIKAEKVNVKYDLTPEGGVTLKGVILNPRAAERFVGEVRQNVIGLASIDSKIKTAENLFTEIRDLAHLSQVDDAVVFRLAGDVVEANGAITTSKIDQWVGFLQAYSKRFSDVIGLRSYVQLQSDAAAGPMIGSSAPLTPILLGGAPSAVGVGLDPAKLKSGDFKLSDAFASRGATAKGARSGAPAPVAVQKPRSAADSPPAAQPPNPPAAALVRTPEAPPAAAPKRAAADSIFRPGPVARNHRLAARASDDQAAPRPPRRRESSKAAPAGALQAPILAQNGAAESSAAPEPAAAPASVKESTRLSSRAELPPPNVSGPRRAGRETVDARRAVSAPAARALHGAKDGQSATDLETAADGSDPQRRPDSARSAFSRSPAAAPAQSTASSAGRRAPASKDDPVPETNGKADAPASARNSHESTKEAGPAGAKVAAATSRRALPATFRHDVGDMTVKASDLITRWLGGRLRLTSGSGVAKDLALEQALDTLADENLGLADPPQSLSEASKELFVRKYLPLFALSRQSNADAARQCRPGSRLSLDDLPAALFWLDLMSTTSAVTLRDFDGDAEGFILEAALNPKLVTACLSRQPSTAALAPESIYLREATRNPEFVRFVTQSLQPFSLDVTGASLENPRFIQMRDGSKLREGEAPDAGSRIDTIGELGVAVLLAGDFATIIYRPDINWIASR